MPPKAPGPCASERTAAAYCNGGSSSAVSTERSLCVISSSTTAECIIDGPPQVLRPVGIKKFFEPGGRLLAQGIQKRFRQKGLRSKQTGHPGRKTTGQNGPRYQKRLAVDRCLSDFSRSCSLCRVTERTSPSLFLAVRVIESGLPTFAVRKARSVVGDRAVSEGVLFCWRNRGFCRETRPLRAEDRRDERNRLLCPCDFSERSP